MVPIVVAMALACTAVGSNVRRTAQSPGTRNLGQGVLILGGVLGVLALVLLIAD